MPWLASAGAKTWVPVLGVPIQSKALSGMDSLLSIAQMPGGIPVGTLAIGPSTMPQTSEGRLNPCERNLWRSIHRACSSGSVWIEMRPWRGPVAGEEEQEWMTS